MPLKHPGKSTIYKQLSLGDPSHGLEILTEGEGSQNTGGKTKCRERKANTSKQSTCPTLKMKSTC